MSDDLDELDAALRRAMAALDGDAPAGYFEALPGRTLARFEDPAIGELPEEPARPLRAVQGVRPPDDADDDAEDDDAVFASQVMAAVELPDEAELSGPEQPGTLPRRDLASASSAIMRAVPVEVDGELGNPGEIRGTGADLGARSASSRITVLPMPPVEPARPEAAAEGVRSTSAAAPMTEVGQARRRRRLRAAIMGLGGIGLAAVATIYLTAGRNGTLILSNGEPAAPASTTAEVSPGAGSGTSVGAVAAGSASSTGPGAAAGSRPAGSDSGVGSAASTPAVAGSGASQGSGSGAVPESLGKFPGPLVKRPGNVKLPSKGRSAKEEVKLPDGGTGKGAVGKKLAPGKPRLDRASLSGDDIERAMTAVAAQARACFPGTRETVSLRLTVVPSGRIAQVAVIGAFAGTPAGACVKRVVLGATFPAWSGAPQSFDYSYLLSD
jgi:hypothetical protein